MTRIEQTRITQTRITSDKRITPTTTLSQRIETLDKELQPLYNWRVLKTKSALLPRCAAPIQQQAVERSLRRKQLYPRW